MIPNWFNEIGHKIVIKILNPPFEIILGANRIMTSAANEPT